MDMEKEIRNITRQIIDKYKPDKIILFGSIVQGKFTPDSDLKVTNWGTVLDSVTLVNETVPTGYYMIS